MLRGVRTGQVPPRRSEARGEQVTQLSSANGGKGLAAQLGDAVAALIRRAVWRQRGVDFETSATSWVWSRTAATSWTWRRAGSQLSCSVESTARSSARRTRKRKRKRKLNRKRKKRPVGGKRRVWRRRLRYSRSEPRIKWQNHTTRRTNNAGGAATRRWVEPHAQGGLRQPGGSRWQRHGETVARRPVAANFAARFHGTVPRVATHGPHSPM